MRSGHHRARACSLWVQGKAPKGAAIGGMQMRLLFGLAVALVPICATPASADCAGDIRASIELLGSSGPYQMISESVTDGIASARITQVVPPARMQSFSISNGETLEFTIIDDKGWGTFRGVTSELPAETLETVSRALRNGMDVNANEIQDAHCQTDGQTELEYNFRTTQGGVVLDAALLVAPHSGLPVQLTIKLAMGSLKSQTMVLYNFDKTIAIRAPQVQ